MKNKPNPSTEKYLFEDYSLIEHTFLLKSEGDIKEFFEDNEELLGDREDGYSSKARFLCKIGEKFYYVTVEANNVSGAKQDVGQRLYECEITNITWEETEKPLPKPRKTVVIEIRATESWINYLESWLKDEEYDFTIKET